MTAQEKQKEFARALYARGILSEAEMNKVINAKFSYSIVETLIDLGARIIDSESGRTILMRMVK